MMMDMKRGQILSAVVVVQMVERSFPLPEIRGSNTVTIKIKGVNQDVAKLIEMVHFVSMKIFETKFFEISFRSCENFDRFRSFCDRKGSKFF